MANVYITRSIPQNGIDILEKAGHTVTVNKLPRPLTQQELISELQKAQYDAVLTLLTDSIDEVVFEAAPTVKIFANFAIGFNNFNIEAAKKRGVYLTNTPGGGADRVAEHTWALILGLTCRVVEGDSYVRSDKYVGWDPMLLHGTKLAGTTLGIIGTGRIGADVAHKAKHGFGMNVCYFDVKRNEILEKDYNAQFCASVEEVLKISDIVSIHVPLMESTFHLMNAERFSCMKKGAYIINTSRGPVIDEHALVDALKSGHLGGAGLDVFEFEPKLTPGLKDFSNVILTPHIASATTESRLDMARISASNIVEVLAGNKPLNSVY